MTTLVANRRRREREEIEGDLDLERNARESTPLQPRKPAPIQSISPIAPVENYKSPPSKSQTSTSFPISPQRTPNMNPSFNKLPSISQSAQLYLTQTHSNNSNNANYRVIPIHEDMEDATVSGYSSKQSYSDKARESFRINILEMAEIVHGVGNKYHNPNKNNSQSYNTSSSISTSDFNENAEEKQDELFPEETTNNIGEKSIELRPETPKTPHFTPITPKSPKISNPFSLGNGTGLGYRRRVRINTDSFTGDTIDSVCTDDDGRSVRSGYENDNEDDDIDVDDIQIISPQIASHPITPITPQWIKSKSLRTDYMPYLQLGLPDEDENALYDSDNEEDMKKIQERVRSVHRRSSSLGDIDGLKEELRRNSGDIDHDKLWKNAWGTSIPLHENSLIEGKDALKGHRFFYHAPKICMNGKKKKRNKKDMSFKVRIKEDTDAVKELEDDVINQMITDSEMSAAENAM